MTYAIPDTRFELSTPKKKPINGVVDWAHPLLKNCVALFECNTSDCKETISGEKPTFVGSSIVKPARFGMGLVLDGVDDCVYWTTSQITLPHAYPFTVMTVIDRDVSADSEEVIISASRESTGVKQGWSLQTDIWNNQNVIGYSLAAVADEPSTITSPVSGNLAVLSSVFKSNSDVDMYLDNTKDTVVSANNPNTATIERYSLGGKWGSGAATPAGDFKGAIYCVLVCEGEVPTSHVSSFQTDPFQFYLPA